MSLISQNLQAVRNSIATAADTVSRRPDSVTLLAVSKTFGADQVLAAVAAGQRAFGENYLQEAVDKMAVVNASMHRVSSTDVVLEWHFIGPIQSNKTRSIAANFDWVHAVDREKIAQRLSDQRPHQLPPLNICLQVNISGENSKSGLAPDQVLVTANVVASLPRLKLRGLMAIPEPTDDMTKQRATFRRMRDIFVQIREPLRTRGLELDTLSMGMSDDMVTAIEEGATIVRIGSAIFGKRDYTYAKQT